MTDHWIICVRTGRTGHTFYPGSTVMQCEHCGHDIWVSPGSLKHVTENHYHVTCGPCALERVDENSSFGVLKETAAEVEAWKRGREGTR